MPSVKHLYVPPNLHQRPPEPNNFDHRIWQSHGTTTALELTKHQLQSTKMKDPPTLKARLIELIKENGAYRRECACYRACFGPSHKLADEVQRISQQLILEICFNPMCPFEISESVYVRTLELKEAAEELKETLSKEVEEWVTSWEAKGGKTKSFDLRI